MQYTKYIAPPKLKSDFLLGGLTLTELLIGLGLLFLFFSVSVKMAFIVVGIWVVFNVRLYEGRSIRTYLGIIIRYHTTRSMVGRPLMDAADIIALEREVFIVLKGGCRPFRSRAEGYYKYLDLGEHKAEELPALDFQEIITFDPEAFMRRNVKMPSCRLTRGMFD